MIHASRILVPIKGNPSDTEVLELAGSVRPAVVGLDVAPAGAADPSAQIGISEQAEDLGGELG